MARYFVICPDLAELQVTGKRDPGMFSRVEVLNPGWVLERIPANPNWIAYHIFREDVHSEEPSLGISPPKLTAAG